MATKKGSSKKKAVAKKADRAVCEKSQQVRIWVMAGAMVIFAAFAVYMVWFSAELTNKLDHISALLRDANNVTSVENGEEAENGNDYGYENGETEE